MRMVFFYENALSKKTVAVHNVTKVIFFHISPQPPTRTTTKNVAFLFVELSPHKIGHSKDC